MKALRALYLGTCLVMASPLFIGWLIYVIGTGIVYMIRYDDSLTDYIKEVVVGPVKYAAWLYGNIIKHGNDYEQYSYDEFTI